MMLKVLTHPLEDTDEIPYSSALWLDQDQIWHMVFDQIC